MTRKRIVHYFITPLTFFLTTLAFTAHADDAAGPATPRISIIIDDIGYRWVDDRRALGLPGPIAYSIMPHSPHAKLMSRLAAEGGKDVLLHLPMEATDEKKNRFLGPGALMTGMSRQQFINTLIDDLASFPNIIGVNNHMGSLLTRHSVHMEWLMKSLRTRDVFYVDSLTSHRSVATHVARKHRVPFLSRDVFLDNRRDEQAINAQFNKLLRIARERGRAVAIGHPHPETISVLARRLSSLRREGVLLVSLKTLVPEPSGLPTLRLTRHP